MARVELLKYFDPSMLKLIEKSNLEVKKFSEELVEIQEASEESVSSTKDAAEPML